MVKKLKRKFVLGSMTAVSLVILIMMIALNTANYLQINQKADDLIQILEENGGKFPEIAPWDQREKPPKPKDGFSEETPYETRYFTVWMKLDGTIESIDTGKIASASTTEAADLAEEIYESGKKKGYTGHYRFHRMEEGEKICITFVDCYRDFDTFWNFLYSSILLAAAGLLAVFCLILLFARMILRPVQESYEKQRRFITDASHEIKTPLAIIRADAEVLELEQGENEWTKSIKNQIGRLTSLTENLILLSRMEEGRQEKRRFSLSNVVSDTVKACQPLATAQQKHICETIQKNIEVYGEERSFRQLVFILVENAVKYSDSCGNITISLCETGKKVMLEVENPAKDVKESDLSNLFDRFYRTDTSRNSQTGGHGIGLSMAKAIVQAHKGEIWASKNEKHNLKITVLLEKKNLETKKIRK